MTWLICLISSLLLARAASAVTVRLDDKDASSTVILHTGDRLRVELPASPATSYRWKAKLFDASHLELLSKDVRPETSRLTSSGIQVFVWKAIARGDAQISIGYGRPDDDRSTPPAKQINLSVSIGPTPLARPDAEADLVPFAAYAGTLPCDGCTAIAVDLTLYASAARQPPSLFVERRRYLGAPGGDRTVAGSGKMAVLHGTYADASMTAYILAAPDGSVENLKVDGDRLLPLDPQMIPLPTATGRDNALHKIDATPD